MLSFLASICTRNIFRSANSPETSRADTLDEEQQTLLDRQQNTGGSRLRHYVVTDTPEPAPPNTPRTPREASPQSPLIPSPQISTNSQQQLKKILNPPTIPEPTPSLEPLALFPRGPNDRRSLPTDCRQQIYSFLSIHEWHNLRLVSHQAQQHMDQYINSDKIYPEYQQHLKGINLLRKPAVELNKIVYQNLNSYFDATNTCKQFIISLITPIFIICICILITITLSTPSTIIATISAYCITIITFIEGISKIGAIIISALISLAIIVCELYFAIYSLLSICVIISYLSNRAEYLFLKCRWKLIDLYTIAKSYLVISKTNTSLMQNHLHPLKNLQISHKRANWLLHKILQHLQQETEEEGYMSKIPNIKLMEDLVTIIAKLKIPFTLPKDFNNPHSKTGLELLKEWRIFRYYNFLPFLKAQLVFMALLYSEESFNRSKFITQVFHKREVNDHLTCQLTNILTDYLHPELFAEFGGLTIIHLAIYLGDPELVKTLITLDRIHRYNNLFLRHQDVPLLHKPAQENSAIGALTPKEYLDWLLMTPERPPSTIGPLAPHWPSNNFKEWQEIQKILEELP